MNSDSKSNARSEISKQRWFSWITLFTSSGTLICCALPIIFVTLGFGAVVAGLTSAFPFMIVLSQHKIWVFVISGLMLTLSGWLLYRKNRHCPVEPELAQLCERAFKWNNRIFLFSVAIWVIGFFAAYMLLPLVKTFGG